MSSTNRGSNRHKDDLYETPEWFTQAIVPELRRRLLKEHADLSSEKLHMYEPACGKGRMVEVLRNEFPEMSTWGTDINGKPSVNFLTEDPHPEYDVIITNPPFSYALDFVKRALEWRKTPQSIVAMVLRLNFLGSIKRSKWLREHVPAVYVTPRRPSFTPNGKTDSVEYAWFLWQEPFKEHSEIGILETEDINPRALVAYPPSKVIVL